MLKLRGLYYITHINNLPSILKRGVLCHRKVVEEKINFTPIYDEAIVCNRKEKKVTEKTNLWDYANLYFQPRNAMLYRVRFFSGVNPKDIIIIGFKRSILDRDDIFITTGNAASPCSEILPSDKARKYLKEIREKTYKEWWAIEDGSKRELMAECLVPDEVSPEYISEIYVCNDSAVNKVKEICGEKISVIPQPELFFLPSKVHKLADTTISLIKGDMFFSRMQTLTISVNTVGVMGKGLASRAKYQFPDVYVKYQDLCRSKILKMGEPYLYKRETSLDFILTDEAEKLNQLNLQTWFLLFPTKTHWREKADIKGIENGLKWLVSHYKNEGIKSLAVPALGCGYGWLSWDVVGPTLCHYLSQLEIPVNLYLPVEKEIPEEQLTSDFLLNWKEKK